MGIWFSREKKVNKLLNNFDFKNFIKLFKRYFFLIFSITWYFLFINSFFINEYWRLSIIFCIILYISIHFLYIEYRNIKLKYIYYWLILLTIIEIIALFVLNDSLFLQYIWIIPFWNNSSLLITNLVILSFIVYNLSIWLLFTAIDLELNNRVKVSPWLLFNWWLKIYSIFISLLFSFFFIIKYNQFSVSCDYLYSNLTSFVEWVSHPLKLSINQIDNFKNYLTKFNSSSIKEIIWYNDSSLTWSTNSIDLSCITNNYTWTSLLNSSWEPIYKIQEKTTLKTSFEKKVLSTYNQILSDKKLLNSTICSYLVDIISSRFATPWFKISVILFMFMIIWPLVSVVFFIVSIISYILFKTFLFIKFYKIVIVEKDIEKIE